MTKGDYAPLIEKIKNRLMGWSTKMLSYAGRLQLVKAVIKSITDFWCSVFRLPSRCFRIIDGMCSAFLWSGSPLNSSKAKVSWADVCTSKAEGGLGLRKLKDSSQVFSLSLIWRLLSNAGSLWVAWVNRDPTICGIIQEISLLKPPDPRGSPDRILWRHADRVFKDHFSAKKTWTLLQNQQQKPRVQWHRAVWFSHAIPRQSFITWLAIRNRLQTGEKVGKWGQDEDCKLCGERSETRSHLFFACPFSFTIWNALSRAMLRRIDPDWNVTLTNISRGTKNKTDSLLARLAFQASIYYIWRERNSRRHNLKRSMPSVIIESIRQEIRNNIISFSPEDSVALCNRWNEISEAT